MSARAARAATGSGSGLGLAGFLVQPADLLGHLRAVANPVIDALKVHLDALLIALGNRIEETDALDVAAVAGAAAVGDDDVVEGALLGLSLIHIYG